MIRVNPAAVHSEGRAGIVPRSGRVRSTPLPTIAALTRWARRCRPATRTIRRRVLYVHLSSR